MCDQSDKSIVPPRASSTRHAAALCLCTVAIVMTALATSAAFGSERPVAQLSAIRGSHPAGSTRTLDHVLTAFAAAHQRGSRALSVRAAEGPIAHIADVNTAIPDLTLHFGYNIDCGPMETPCPPTDTTGGRLQLLGTLVSPFYPDHEQGYTTCVHCTCPHCGAAHGHWIITNSPSQFSWSTWHARWQGPKIFMSTRARWFVVVTSPDEIGRIKVYEDNGQLRHPHPVQILSACIPASLTVATITTQISHKNWRSFPTVPCAGSTPSGDQITVNTPVEFPTAGGSPASISGYASGRQWLTAFFQTSECAPDSIADAPLAQHLNPVQVDGHFNTRFQTPAVTGPGFICVYLQTGRLISLGGGAVVPDGRVGDTAVWAFFAGDKLTITGPTAATAGQAVQETYNGTASMPEQLYSFRATAPCATSAEAEFAVDPSVVSAAKPAGPFSTPVNIPLPLQSPPVVYLCAYLQYGAPSSSAPVGPTLAMATAKLSVAVSTTTTPTTTTSTTTTTTKSTTPTTTTSTTTTTTTTTPPPSVTLTAPSTIAQGQSVSITARGTAPAGAELYVFGISKPCAVTAQDEYAIDSSVYSTAEPTGSYSTSLPESIDVTYSQPVLNICAYLQLGAPSNGQPTGATVATASTQLDVTLSSVHINASSDAYAGEVTQETFTGHATVEEELYVYVSPTSCASTAQAEESQGVDASYAEPAGDFSTGQTMTTFPPGVPVIYECAYLLAGTQTNGQPTGPTIASASFEFTVTQSTVQINGQSTGLYAGEVVPETYTGFATVSEELYVFLAPTPCASTAQVEYTEAVAGFPAAVPAGDFSIPNTITIPSGPLLYQCAYLQVGAPSNGQPTGPTYATASQELL